jgi:hypothetical protein
LIDWMNLYRVFWRDRVRAPGKSAEQDGSMNNPATATRSVVIEREMPHRQEKVWRALTRVR